MATDIQMLKSNVNGDKVDIELTVRIELSWVTHKGTPKLSIQQRG